MKRIKKSWIALLSGALLMATLVGAVWARPALQATTYKLTIPPGHFHPREDGYDWYNWGSYLKMMSGGPGYFYAALPIALPGRFTVEKLTLFAYDANNSEDVCAYLFRVNPWTRDKTLMAVICTSDTSGYQQPSTTSFTPDTMYGAHGGYVQLYLGDATSLEAYAVQIEYH